MKTLTTRSLCLLLICFLLNLWVVTPAFTQEVSDKNEDSKENITEHTPEMILSEELEIPETDAQEKSWLSRNKWWVILGVAVVAGGVAASSGGGGGEKKEPTSTGQITATW